MLIFWKPKRTLASSLPDSEYWRAVTCGINQMGTKFNLYILAICAALLCFLESAGIARYKTCWPHRIRFVESVVTHCFVIERGRRAHCGRGLYEFVVSSFEYNIIIVILIAGDTCHRSIIYLYVCRFIRAVCPWNG